MMALPLHSSSFTALGGPCSVHLYAKTAEEAHRAIGLAQAEINRIECRFSRYRSDSVISRMNKVAARGGTIEVDEETRGLLRYARSCYDKSGGLFDITSGLFRRAWNFKSNRVPSEEEIAKLLPFVGMDKITIASASITFVSAGMEIDLGGIGKEYAADRAAAVCLEANISHGIVDLGGDVRLIGPHPDGAPWTIGIRDPLTPNQVVGHVSLTEGALATSGDYQRRIQFGNKSYSHLINPKTGRPVEGLASVSVVADQCLAAGSVSSIALLKGKEGVIWLSRLDPELRYAWIDSAGTFGGSLSAEIKLASNNH